ncbi:hemolysin III family protein [Marinibaculum pumilum]|uniref:Hemolysin III family protein n=1 Tax=Marinibaculum pumilum TaxID=1766165 RepID=A0ABV7L911_9PROT
MAKSRVLTRPERIADAIVHVVGLACGLAACIALAAIAAPSADARLGIALAVYGAGLMTMLGCSAAYNLSRSPRQKRWLRRIDHAAIFVMIAGTYTPFAMISLQGAWGWGLLGFVWVVALAGVAAKLFLAERFERFSIPAYLLLGWTVLVALEPLLSALSLAGLLLLGIGGLLYTIGVLFYRWERLPFQTAIWHVFVLAAAACHFSAVLGDVVLAAA